MTQRFSYQISDFREFEDWRDTQEAQEPLNLFLVSICDLISSDDGQKRVALWARSIDVLRSTSADPYNDFVMAEKFLSKFQISFLSLSVEVATAAVMDENTELFLTAAQKFADATRLVAFRFIAAWTYLNTDRLERCIEECVKVDEPYSPVLTLLGQAYLETNQPERAIKVFEQAVDHDPNEILAWFQLAKSYSVLDQHEETWNCLVQCNRLSPQNLEVAAFVALSALKAPTADKCLLAWNLLEPHLETFTNDLFAIDLVLSLALILEDDQKIGSVLKVAHWKEFSKTDDGREKMSFYDLTLKQMNSTHANFIENFR